MYEEINNIIKQFIIVLSIKDVMSCYTHLYSLQQWLKNILPPTSNIYWKALSSKYTDSDFIYKKMTDPKIIPCNTISFI